MPRVVQANDGTVHVFPDDYTEEDIQEALRQQVTPTALAPPPPPPPKEGVGARTVLMPGTEKRPPVWMTLPEVPPGAQVPRLESLPRVEMPRPGIAEMYATALGVLPPSLGTPPEEMSRGAQVVQGVAEELMKPSLGIAPLVRQEGGGYGWAPKEEMEVAHLAQLPSPAGAIIRRLPAGKAQDAFAGIHNALAGFTNFLLSPAGLPAFLVARGGGGVAKAFGLDKLGAGAEAAINKTLASLYGTSMAMHLPESATQAAQAFQQGDYQAGFEQATSTALGAIFTGLLGKALIEPVAPRGPRTTTPPAVAVPPAEAVPKEAAKPEKAPVKRQPGPPTVTAKNFATVVKRIQAAERVEDIPAYRVGKLSETQELQLRTLLDDKRAALEGREVSAEPIRVTGPTGEVVREIARLPVKPAAKATKPTAAPAVAKAPPVPVEPAGVKEVKAPAKVKTKAKTPAKVTAPTEVKAPTKVVAPAEVTAPAEVKVPAEVKAPAEVKTPTEVKAPVEVKAKKVVAEAVKPAGKPDALVESAKARLKQFYGLPTTQKLSPRIEERHGLTKEPVAAAQRILEAKDLNDLLSREAQARMVRQGKLPPPPQEVAKVEAAPVKSEVPVAEEAAGVASLLIDYANATTPAKQRALRDRLKAEGDVGGAEYKARRAAVLDELERKLAGEERPKKQTKKGGETRALQQQKEEGPKALSKELQRKVELALKGLLDATPERKLTALEKMRKVREDILAGRGPKTANLEVVEEAIRQLERSLAPPKGKAEAPVVEAPATGAKPAVARTEKKAPLHPVREALQESTTTLKLGGHFGGTEEALHDALAALMKVYYDRDPARVYVPARFKRLVEWAKGLERPVRQEGEVFYTNKGRKVVPSDFPSLEFFKAQETVEHLLKLSDKARTLVGASRMPKELASPALVELDKAVGGALLEGRSVYEVVERLVKVVPDAQAKEALQWLLDNVPELLREMDVYVGGGAPRKWHVGMVASPTRVAISGRSYTGDITQFARDLLHEVGHALTAEALTSPRTPREKAAVARLEQLRQELIEALPEQVRETYKDVEATLQKVDDLFRQGRVADAERLRDELLRRVAEKSHMEWFPALEALRSKQELVAGWFNLSSVKTMLDSVGGGRLTEVLHELTGAATEKGGGALLEIVKALSRDRFVDVPQLELHFRLLMPLADLKTKFSVWRNRRNRVSLPVMTAVNPELADAGAAYAAARSAAPEMVKWMLMQALGRDWYKPEFRRRIGAIAVWDALETQKAQFRKLAKEEKDPQKAAYWLERADQVADFWKLPDNPFSSPAELRAALKDKRVLEALDNYRARVQPQLEVMHRTLGGKLRQPGKETGVFVNLLVKGHEPSYAMIGRKHPLRGLVRSSRFARPRKGTGVAYEFDLEKIVANSVIGNYEMYALRTLYDTLLRARVAVPGKGPVPEWNGKKYRPMTIRIVGAGEGKARWLNIYVRPDIFNELNGLVNPVAMPSGVLDKVLRAVTTIQVQGPTDITYHVVNQVMAVATAQGAHVKPLVDFIRFSRLGPTGVVDAVARLAKEWAKVLLTSPETLRLLERLGTPEGAMTWLVDKGILTQERVAELSRIGAGRYYASHGVAFAKLSEALIHHFDKAGRLVLDRFYTNLVQRQWAQPTIEGRRRFIEKMLQYHEGLLPRWEALLRRHGVGPFVVAGRGMNRLARQRLLLDPGVLAASPSAWVKLRVMELWGLLATVFAFPLAMNFLLHGSVFPRDGVPLGAIDLGKDDEQGRPLYYDPAQHYGYRRGARLFGLRALEEGLREGKPWEQTAQAMVRDIFQGYLHPITGPGVEVLTSLVSGRSLSGHILASNPYSPEERLWASLAHLNPAFEAYAKGIMEAPVETPEAGLKEVGLSLAAAFGYKRGRLVPYAVRERKLLQEHGFDPEAATVAQRIFARQEFERREFPRRLQQAQRKAAERTLWEGFATQDKLRKQLDKDVQAFVKKNDLRVPATDPSFNVAVARLSLRHDEFEQLLKFVAEEYNSTFRTLMQLPVEKLPRSWRDDFISDRLTEARERARQRLVLEIERKAAERRSRVGQ